MKTLYILKTQIGSPNGIVCVQYKQGETVEMPESLAEVFLSEGWAITAEQHEAEEKAKAAKEAAKGKAPASTPSKEEKNSSK